MQRATGSIPYTSLMWNRKYYECGDFLMEVPANVYDPSWAYIYTEERPETGIIQKVEYSDTSQVAGGVDTVILSGFFMEYNLNRYTFLVEETEDQAYRIYKPAPAKTIMPTMWSDNLGQVYVKTGGTGGVLARWETIDGDYVDPSTVNQSEMTQIDLQPGDGLTLIEYDTTNTDRFPSGKWNAGEYSNKNYSYYSEDGKTLHSVAPDGTETTYGIVRGGTGDVIYEDSEGNFKWVNGVASSVDSTYVRAVDSWESKVKSEGLEVVKGDGTIFGGSTYARAYRTVKGPWQLRTDLDVNEPADNVQRIIQWAQDIWGNNLLYDEVGFTGESKIIDPSLKLFGDLAYEELKTVEASPRLFYSFESDTAVLQIWRGLDRTQSQAGVPSPDVPEPEPEEPTIDELYEAVDYIESDGTQYIDTGFYANNNTRVVVDAQYTTAQTSNGFLFGARTSKSKNNYSFLWEGGNSYFRSDYNTSASQTWEVDPTVRRTYDKNAETTTINGVSQSYANAEFECEHPMYLFTLNSNGNVSTAAAVARTWSWQIYGDGTALTMNLMPYRRKADGVYGLLDLVNEVFYESASEYAFTGPSYPAGTYEELDYIVSTGEQYIDTGFYADQDSSVVLDAELLSITANGVSTPVLLGSYLSSSNQFALLYNQGQAAWFGSSGTVRLSTAYSGRKVFSLENGTFSAGEENTALSVGTFTSTSPVFMFALNHTDKGAMYNAAMRVYSCKFFAGGNLSRDYVPRRRVSDGAVGLLDLANDTFYESAGTEPFYAPGELPSGYTRLEYIESTGSQYIDTGYLPNQNTRIEAGVNVTGFPNNMNAFIYGSRIAKSNDGFYLAAYRNSQSWAFGFADGHVDFDATTLGSHTIVHDGAMLSLDETSANVTSSSFQSEYSLYLGGLNHAGSLNSQIGSMRFDYCSISEGGTPKRDYVPAKNSSGEAGLFDLVTMSFYEDAAGVGFVAGPEAAADAEAAEVSTFSLTRTVAISETNEETANPFAVFSDTWGTLYGFTASRDVSNYRNTCYVLYQFRDQTDADGNPIGPRGYVKARLEDELPDAETYLDLRGEEPEDDTQTDEAFIESLRQRGIAHLKANYAVIESLDTGTLIQDGYLSGFDLGDKVDMLVEAVGLVKEARITGCCEIHEAGSSTVSLEIGEQKLTDIRKAVIV